MYYFVIGTIITVALLLSVCSYLRSVEAREDMLVALRRENTQLIRDKLSLEEKNMRLLDENYALEQQLRRARAKQSIRETNSDDIIAALQAECRRKDNIINQKWMIAKGTYEAAKR